MSVWNCQEKGGHVSDRRNTVIPCDAEGKAETFISSAALVQDSDRTSFFLKCYQLTSEV